MLFDLDQGDDRELVALGVYGEDKAFGAALVRRARWQGLHEQAAAASRSRLAIARSRAAKRGQDSYPMTSRGK